LQEDIYKIKINVKCLKSITPLVHSIDQLTLVKISNKILMIRH